MIFTRELRDSLPEFLHSQFPSLKSEGLVRFSGAFVEHAEQIRFLSCKYRSADNRSAERCPPGPSITGQARVREIGRVTRPTDLLMVFAVPYCGGRIQRQAVALIP